MQRFWGRRDVLAGSLGLAALSLPSVGFAKAADLRTLELVNLHTQEELRATYWKGGERVPTACRKIDHLLRDHRTGEEIEISPRLLDLLHALKKRIGADTPYEVISGYRSPATNAALTRTSSGVAKKSLHMQGMAVDIRLPGCPLRDLREAAVSLKAGGVGFYPKSGFVHIDVGRVRYW